jgi:hypothetical protein
MNRVDAYLRVILLAIAVFLGIIAARTLFEPVTNAHAQSAQFDHVTIISAVFLYKGEQGLLVMDRRNANVWFIPRRDEVYQNPVYIMRLPFDKLDQAPR